MSANQDKEQQSKETLEFFKSIPGIISNAIEDQKRGEAERKAITDKFIAKQVQSGLAELEILKNRLSQALPGELKRIKRKISLQQGGVEATTRYILNEQERIEIDLQRHYLHRKYISLSVHAVAPEEMWEHYKSLKPGDIQAVYEYQLLRELHAFLENELSALDGVLKNLNTLNVDDRKNSEISDSSPNRDFYTTKSKQPSGKISFEDQPKDDNELSKTYDELFLKPDEGARVMKLLLAEKYVDENSQWLGRKTTLIALIYVLNDSNAFGLSNDLILIGNVFRNHFKLDFSDRLLYVYPDKGKAAKSYSEFNQLIFNK